MFSLLLFFLAYCAPQHLVDAQLLQENVLPSDNSYRHKDLQATWKGRNSAEKYSHHADCSGFLDILLMHTYNYSMQDLQKWMGGKIRPLSKNFYEAISAENGFIKIFKIDDVLPGDIIAIRYAPGQNDSGHAMLLASFPSASPSSPPIVEGTKQSVVTIIDSTTNGHRPNDSRISQQGDFQSGLGKAVIRLYTDASGNFCGYCWSTSEESKYFSMNERPFAIGRLKAAK